MLKHKRIILIACAVLFLVSLFLIKNRSWFFNSEDYAKDSGIAYNKAIIDDLVNRDVDGDGVLDWEEGLWGTDPTKKDSNDDGVSDSVEIEKLKKAQGVNESTSSSQEPENLTETDKFSREFFSTVATLNESGAMDQETADRLSQSLAEKIQNATPEKVFTLSDIKITKTETSATAKAYNDSLNGVQAKYPMNSSVYDVLQKFIIDENTVDASVLTQLDPIISQSKKMIADMTKISVPQSLAPRHVELLNALERLLENVADIRLYDTDAIVALQGISQYETNTAALETTVLNLDAAIRAKLSN